MKIAEELSDLSQRADSNTSSWRLKPKQLLAVVLLILIITAQVLWALRSIASYAAERREFISQETDIASLTFTQRDSFTLLQRFDRWTLGEASARDVLVARANLAQRLSVITGSGATTYSTTHEGYKKALGEFDEVLEDITQVENSVKNDFRINNLKVLNRFEIETRQLSSTFQNILVNQLRESLRQRVVAESIYVGLLILSLAIFTGIVIWLGTDIIRTYRQTSDKLKFETKILEINRNRLLFIVTLEKLSALIVKKIDADEETKVLEENILNFVKELLPDYEINFTEDSGIRSISTVADQSLIIEEDRLRVVARADELLSMLNIRDKARELIDFQSNHDLLTGLANRQYFSHQLNQRLQDPNLKNGLLVIALDLDRFSAINNALGFSVGDDLLKEVATRLKNNFTEDEVIARMTSDEFAIITFADTLAVAQAKANLVKDLTHFTTFLAGLNSPVSASIGAVWVNQADSPATEIIGQVSVALQVARESTDEQLVFFDQELHKKLSSAWLDDLELHKSFRNGDFVLYYQPVIELSTREITGFEALLRWNKPGQGLLYPNDFLENLDRAGLMLDIGRQVLEQAFLAFKRTLTRVSTVDNPFISVNVDPKQLLDSTFSSYLLILAKRLGVSCDSIVLEITERYLTEGQIATNNLNLLRSAGIKIAIDDFGTGYSNFSQLRDLPVDIVKLDKSFSQNLSETSENLGLISDMLNMTSRLNLKVVAEGIESETAKEKLREIGVAFGQGYLFAQALPETQLLEWSSTWN
jgi:diguanylate cyclase (GGDEF)-like protein